MSDNTVQEPAADAHPVDEPQDHVEAEPTQEGGTPDVDYRKRYDDLRPQYDRTQSELAQLRKEQEAIRNDPEAQRRFLQELGYDLEDPEPDDFPVDDGDPVSALEQRLAAIEAKEQEKARREAEEAQSREIEQHFAQAFSDIDPNGDLLDEEDRDWVVTRALTLPPTESGQPNVKAAYEALVARDRAKQQKWAESKKTGHSFSPAGQAGTETPNLDDPEVRQAWMAQRLADLNADS